MAFSQDGKWLASPSGKTSATIWSLSGDVKPIKLEGHTNRIINVCFSRDSKYLAVASGGGDFNYTREGEVRIWDINTATSIARLDLKGRASAVAFSRDDSRVVVGLYGKALIWDPSSSKITREMRVRGRVNSIGFSHDESQIVVGTSNKEIHRINYDVGTETRTTQADAQSVYDAAFTTDGKHFITGGSDAIIKFRDRKTGKVTKQLKGHTHSILGLAVSPDGTRLVSTARTNNNSKDAGSLRVWDVTTEKTLFELKGHTRFARKVAFSPNGKLIASAGLNIEAIIWDADSGREIRRLLGSATIHVVQFAKNGKYVATGDSDGNVDLWRLDNGGHVLKMSGHTSQIHDIAFDPNSQVLASASRDDTIKLWHIKTRKELHTLKGHIADVSCVSFSPDGKRLVSGGKRHDNMVKLWDTTSGLEVLTLSGHSNGVTSVDFSSDGHFILSTSLDGTIKRWDGSPASP